MSETLQHVREYYESDEVIGYFLDPDFFDRLVWHTQFHFRDDRGEWIDETSHLIRWARIAPGQKVLDFGCGVGSLCLRLASRHGCLAYGVNISRRQIEIAQEETRGLERVCFEVYDGERLPYPPEQFDAVLFQESMCHVSDKPAMLRQIFRVLKPGGVLAGQDWFSRGESAATLVATIDAQYHTSLESMERYARWAAAAGFSAVETADCRELPGCDALEKFGGQGFQEATAKEAFTVGFFKAVKPLQA